MAQATGTVERIGQDHHVGFNEALEKALHEMDGKFAKGKHTVDVRFQLVEVEVASPGSVGFYQVTVTTS